MLNFNFLDAVILGVLAIFIIIRFRGLLGKKVGYAGPEQRIEEKIEEVKEDEQELRLMSQLQINEQMMLDLMRLREMQRTFKLSSFLQKAALAVEKVIISFTKGQKTELATLCAPSLCKKFSAEIAKRGKVATQEETEVVGTNLLKIEEFSAKNQIFTFVLMFEIRTIRYRCDQKGEVAKEKSTEVKQSRSRWHFDSTFMSPTSPLAWKVAKIEAVTS